MMQLSHRCRPRYAAGVPNETTATLEKDFYLNLIVVLLLMIGGNSLLVGARTANQAHLKSKDDGYHVFLSRDGSIHIGSLENPEVTVEELISVISATTHKTEPAPPIIINHTPDTKGGLLHQILNAVQTVHSEGAWLALYEDTAQVQANGR